MFVPLLQDLYMSFTLSTHFLLSFNTLYVFSYLLTHCKNNIAKGENYTMIKIIEIMNNDTKAYGIREFKNCNLYVFGIKYFSQVVPKS